MVGWETVQPRGRLPLRRRSSGGDGAGRPARSRPRRCARQGRPIQSTERTMSSSEKNFFLMPKPWTKGVSGPVGRRSDRVPAITYQQKALMRVDRRGDLILRRLFLNTCQTGFRKCRQLENIPPQPSQMRSPRFARENPILSRDSERTADNAKPRKARPLFDVQVTLDALKRIIREENRKGHRIFPGRKHVWGLGSLDWSRGSVARGFGHLLTRVMFSAFIPSKILVALGTASSARFMYVGKEVPLIEWIKRQPDGTLTIESLFRESFALNDGDVYLAILTIENVLSDAAFEPDRENTAVNRKLPDLYAASPNKFGDWYHLFGTMLAGYSGAPARLIAWLYSVYRRISRGKAAERSTMAADRAGARIGTGLRRFVGRRLVGGFFRERGTTSSARSSPARPRATARRSRAGRRCSIGTVRS